jgi:hypothetical protein
MPPMSALRLHLGFVLLALLTPCPALSSALPDSIPTVYATLIRVDGRNLTFNGYYELNASYHKLLVPTGFTQYDCLLAGSYEEESELYYDDVYNRLTGELLVRTVQWWSSPSEFAYPPDSLRRTDIETGFSPPEPDTLFAFPSQIPREEARAVWDVARGTNVIQRLAEHGRYRVGITQWHPGAPDSSGWPHEWLIVASTQPVAPREAALLQLNWPLRVVSVEIPFAPEVVAHNFSDVPIDVGIHLLLRGDSGELYDETRELAAFPSDSTRRVVFSPMTLAGAAEAHVSLDLEAMDGSAWADAYPDNDSLSHSFRSSPLPVFRRVIPARPLGSFPLEGTLIDFDRDGKMDVFQRAWAPRLLHNLGDGQFADITGQVSVHFRPWPYSAFCADLTGDARPDLLILNFEERPMLLSGDGSGFFDEITEEAGLAGIVSYGEGAIADLDSDGDLDIVFASHGQESVVLNDGSGHFRDVTDTSGLIDPGQTETIATGDLNGDGLVDLVFVNWEQRSKVLANMGGGHFGLVAGPWGFTHARHALILDWDGDGLNDIVFARYNEATEVYRNLGGLTFEHVPPDSTGLPKTWNISAGDFDRNGQPELACGYAIRRRENGRWVSYTDLLNMPSGAAKMSGGAPASPVFMDLDCDGDLDLYGESMILENMGVPAGPDVTAPSLPGESLAIGVSNAIALSWINPPDQDAEGSIVRYSPQRYPVSPADGLPIPNGQNGMVRGGPGGLQCYLHSSLSAGTTLYYSVFAFDHAGNVSGAGRAHATAAAPCAESTCMWIEQSPSSNRSFEAWLTSSPDADSSATLLDGIPLNMSVVCAEAGLARGSFQCAALGDHHLSACVTHHGEEDCSAGTFTLAAVAADHGGYLSSPDGRVHLRLLAGAVPQDTTLTYVPEELLSPGQHPGHDQLGRFSVLPPLLLETPALLTYRYSEADLGAGQDPSRLCLSLDGSPALSCTVDPESLTVRATVSRLGLFSCTLGDPGMSTVWDHDFISLRAAGANPAQESSRFQVVLRAPERVRAAVYDVAGREIVRLLDETLGPGERTISWSGKTTRGTEAGTGVYFLRVWSSHRSVTARAVRVR